VVVRDLRFPKRHNARVLGTARSLIIAYDLNLKDIN